MIRRCSLILAFGWGLAMAAQLPAAAVDEIIPQAAIEAHGLTRAWMEQLDVANRVNRVTNVVLDAGVLFVQTEKSRLQAFDAETGRPLWNETKVVGNPDLVSYPLAVNHSLVAIINGSQLYVLNRFTGETLLEKKLNGVVGAGPTLSDHHVFVPLSSGLMMAYRLKPRANPLQELGKTTANGENGKGESKAEGDESNPSSRENYRLAQELSAPLSCQSAPGVRVQPVMARQGTEEEYIAWPTDAGYLYICMIDAEIESFVPKYRITAEGPFDASVTYLPPPPKPVQTPKTDKDADAADKPAATDGDKPADADKDADKPADKAADKDADAKAPADDAAAKPAKTAAKHGKDKIDHTAGTIFAVSRAGSAYAINEKTGETLWQFDITEPIDMPVTVIGGNVYLTTELGGLYCLDAATGARKWSAPGIQQFTALGKDRVYGMDRFKRLVSLDPQTGMPLGTIAIPSHETKVVMNGQTDRLYMVTPGGLIQCLHEAALTQPLVYATPHVPEPEKVAKAKKTEEGEKPKPKPPSEKPAGEKPKPKPKPKAEAVDAADKPEKPAKTPRTPKTPRTKGKQPPSN